MQTKFHIFLLLNSEMNCGESWNKRPPLLAKS